jgi:carbon-monoxide dehydrogenase large subunit
MAGGLSPLNQLMLTGRYQPLAHADLEETMSQIGARRPRVEDERLVTGLGRYAADVRPPGLCHLAVLRSPLPHARIRRLDVEPARSLPGVLAVWTAGDLGSVGLPEGFPPLPPLERVHRQPLLAAGETCHQGEALAVVVALTPEVAADAVERIELELDPLPAVGGADVALAGPPVHEGDPANSAGRLVIEFGDVEAAFTGAPVRVAATLRAARICGAAMEPRAVTAIPEGDGLVVHASTQSVFAVRQAVADALGLASEQVRVLAEDVGGGFGAKGEPFPEEVLVAHAARRLGRPVRWVATRSEDGATTSQSHGSVLELELAAESDGRLRGLRGRFLHDLGAFAGSGTGQGGNAVMHMVSVYRLPALRIELVPIYTCEARTGFIRGGGREIGNFAIERMVDLLADRLGMDRAAIRERNLLRPDQMPYDTGFRMGEVPVRYDLGDVPAMLARIRELVRELPLGPDGSVTRGIGIACYAESTGFGQGEPARVRVGRDGIATVQVGSTPQGQGHQTMVTQVVADRLGWRPERIRVRAGDTQGLPFALLTAGSRSAVHVGNAAAMAARAARRRLLELAAARLEADPEDLVLGDGVVAVRGTPARSLEAAELVPEEGLEVEEHFSTDRPTTWASGCHAAVVEVDLETLRVDVVRYLIAHDCGRMINPALVEGQIHGGLAHGIGYALFEDAHYDPDGTFRAPSFLDYSIVSAPEMRVDLWLDHFGGTSPANPEGVRGVGEAGTIPVPAAICSAVEDALRRAGHQVRLNAIPITGDGLYRLLRQAGGGELET